MIQGQVEEVCVTPLETDKNDHLSLAPLSHNILHISCLLVVNHCFSSDMGGGQCFQCPPPIFRKYCEQAGAELGQAQLKLGFDLILIFCRFGFLIIGLVELGLWI